MNKEKLEKLKEELKELKEELWDEIYDINDNKLRREPLTVVLGLHRRYEEIREAYFAVQYMIEDMEKGEPK